VSIHFLGVVVVLDALQWGEYVLVVLWSGFKFMVGVALSLGLGMTWSERLLTTLVGGVAGVLLFCYFGAALRRQIRRWRKLPDAPAQPSAFQQRVWQRYGLWGVALLTPPLFSPPIGAAIVLAFGTPPAQAARAMAMAMLLWAVVFTALGELPTVQQWLARLR